jgi:hypothetical protein
VNRRTFLTNVATVATVAIAPDFLHAVAGQRSDDKNLCQNLCTIKDDDSQTGKIKRAIGYPYDRAVSSYLFVQDGRTLCGKGFQYIKVDKDDPMSAGSLLRTQEGTVSIPEFLKRYGLSSNPNPPRTAVIGYGSNPAIEQLARKFGNHKDYGPFCGNPVIPVIKARIRDFDVVYMGHIASYGAVGATLASSQGTEAEIWLTFLTADQLKRMHETESVGRVYDYGILEGVSITLENGHSIHRASIYIDRFGALLWNDDLISLTKVNASNRKYASLREDQMLDKLRARFSPDAQLDEFILENIGNAQKRDERNSILHEITRRFSNTAFREE